MKKFGFTLAEVLIAKREREEISLLKLFRTRELKAPSNKLLTRCAFTLAEVLITLGIIGVVAALTIPTLVKNHQKAELKSGFQKANAIVNTVIQQLVIEKSIIELKKEYCYQNDASCKSGEYTGMNSSQKLVKDMLPYLDTIAVRNGDFDYTKNPADTRPQACNFSKQSCHLFDIYRAGYGLPYYPSIYLKDGSIINIDAPSNAFPQIVYDTNGNRGPNRLGYDMFYWVLSGVKASPTAWGYGEDMACDLTHNGSMRVGAECSYYAAIDKCPWDDTKGYWECLP